jgi:hypothetical protein
MPYKNSLDDLFGSHPIQDASGVSTDRRFRSRRGLPMTGQVERIYRPTRKSAYLRRPEQMMAASPVD